MFAWQAIEVAEKIALQQNWPWGKNVRARSRRQWIFFGNRTWEIACVTGKGLVFIRFVEGAEATPLVKEFLPGPELENDNPLPCK